MHRLIPKIASAHQIQAQYRKLFNDVIENREPLIILNNNKPEVVIIDIQTFESLNEISEKYEQDQARKAIEIYQKEKKSGKLKQLKSLADLT